MAIVGGVFVGGASRRMGGAAKGLLAAPGGETLVGRALRVLREGGVDEVVLVGQRPEYELAGVRALPDEPKGIGPLGGLIALLRHAAGGHAVALACDMPFVSPALVRRLLEAPPASVVAPRCGGFWQPLCARYDAAAVLPLAVERADRADLGLQGLLGAAGAVDPDLTDEHAAELHDWDTPEDVRAATSRPPRR